MEVEVITKFHSTRVEEDTKVQTGDFPLVEVARIFIKEVDAVQIFIREAGVEPLIRIKVGEIDQEIAQTRSFTIPMALLLFSLNRLTPFLHLINPLTHPQPFHQWFL